MSALLNPSLPSGHSSVDSSAYTSSPAVAARFSPTARHSLRSGPATHPGMQDGTQAGTLAGTQAGTQAGAYPRTQAAAGAVPEMISPFPPNHIISLIVDDLHTSLATFLAPAYPVLLLKIFASSV
ncbi:hypothetical protein GGF42_003753 [Coemansia sp. RSA 2424]|nr:hypothetical protein GGF42_003753 [Coemansia sp. RSA 2424]